MCKNLMVLPIFIALVACSSSFEVVEIPRHEADLYPHSESKQNVTVAIDEISSKDRVVSYFGADLTKDGILPVNIIISNNGSQRFELRPSDILLRRGSLVIDPIPLERVTKIVIKRSGRHSKKTEKQIEQYFSDLFFKESILEPKDTFDGVMFFYTARKKEETDPEFSNLKIFKGGELRLEVAITSHQSNERIHFGPFALSK